jgi:hypothetical protein
MVSLHNGKLQNFKLFELHIYPTSRDNAVGIATGYRLDDRGFGVQVPVVLRIFSSPRSPDRIWGAPALLSNGYRGFFLRG